MSALGRELSFDHVRSRPLADVTHFAQNVASSYIEGPPNTMRTIDEEIARHLRQAAEAGELKSAPSFGKPFAQDVGWDETPQALRMPFKILKDAGVPPPEIELFHERARIRAGWKANRTKRDAWRLELS